MPLKINPGCRMQGCPKIAVHSGWCEDHFRIVPKPPRPLDTRPPAHQRGYNWTWFNIRNAYLKTHPVCENPSCGSLAQLVDHIRPISLGGTNDKDNLQSLCRRCHSMKTERYDRRFARKYEPKQY